MSKLSGLRNVLGAFQEMGRRRERRRRGVATVERLESRVLLSLSVTVQVHHAGSVVEGGYVTATFTAHTGGGSSGYMEPWVIDWGDGHIDDQSMTTSDNPLVRVHQYADATQTNITGTAYSDSVSPSHRYSASSSTAAGLEDAPLAYGGGTMIVSAAEGDVNIVAGWTDTGDSGEGGSSDYSVSVDWGAGASNTGSPSISGSQAAVDATYTEAGTFSGNVMHVSDNDGSQVDIPFTVIVDDDAVTQIPKPPPRCTKPVDPDPAVTEPIPGPWSGGFGSGDNMPMLKGPAVKRGLILGLDYSNYSNYSKPTVDGAMNYSGEVDDYGNFQLIGGDGDGNIRDQSSQPIYLHFPKHTQSNVPHMIQMNRGGLYGVVCGRSALYFSYGGGSFTESFNYGDSLTHNSATHTYTFTSFGGATAVFYDFTNGNLSGMMKTFTDASGNDTTYNNDGSQYLTEIINSSTTGTVTTKQSFLYSYSGGYVFSILLRRKIYDSSLGQNDGNTSYVNVQSSAYAYYSNGDSGGNAGDLKTATLKDASGTTIDVSYYRYWPGGTSVGGVSQPADVLKYYLSGPSYARAVAGLPSGVTPLTASDSQLAPYADSYVEYDSYHRPSKLIAQGSGCSSCSGGQGTFTYAYAINSNDTGLFNSWNLKVTETLPDGTVQYHYYDANGLEMLSVVNDGNGHLLGTFTEYDSNGNPILVAQPSAVSLPGSLSTIEAYNDLLHYTSGNYQYLSDSAGLIETTAYYGSTTASSSVAGGAAGLVSDTYVQQGETGTAIQQEHLAYFAVTANGATVYPVATDTVYGNTDGTDARVTSNRYTMYSGTTQVKQLTVGLPAITSTQNGADVNSTATGGSTTTLVDSGLSSSGSFVGDMLTVLGGTDAGQSAIVTAYNSSTHTLTLSPAFSSAIGTSSVYTLSSNVSYSFYDTYGRPIWTKDADGHVNYAAYDAGTGAVTKSIIDVVYSSLTSDEQTSFGNTGWSNPSGGLNLVTTDVVDGLGRATKETSPNGNITYTVYNDAGHEVRVYPGFASGATTGPIQIYRTYYPSANSSNFFYTETMTSSATPHLTSSVPDGTETLSASNIQSLSRDFYNSGGQVIWSDSYFSFSGITYSQTVGVSSGVPANLGTNGTNFYRTTNGFDEAGREDRVVMPTGTIYRTVFDALGRVISRWVGTTDTHSGDDWTPSTNTGNMMKIEDDVYDSGGVGDSNLTQVTQRVDTSSSDDRVSQFLYDFRDRLVAEKSGVQSNEIPSTQFAAQQTWSVSGTYSPIAALADVNGDGKPDVVVANNSSNSISVLLGNGDGTFQAQTTFTTASGPISVAVADVNGDGKPDVVVANYTAGNVALLLGNGNGTFQAQTTFAVGSSPFSVVVGDLNGDGKPDIVCGNYNGSSVSVLLGNGNGTFHAQQTFSVNAKPDSVAIVNVNLDGKPDLVVANFTGGGVNVLLGNGNGTFQPTHTFAAGTHPESVAGGDVNLDGVPDLVVANGSSNNVSVLLGNGNGTFQAQTTLAVGTYPRSAAVADVNGDGRPDIVCTNDTGGTVSLLLGNGNGTFQSQQTVSTGSGPIGLALADLNGDGKPDIVVCNVSGHNVSAFLNQTATSVFRPIVYFALDNLGEAVRRYQYEGAGVSLSDFSTAAITDAIPTADAYKVRALRVDSYDDQGRVCRSQALNIDQNSGTSGLSDSQILGLSNLATDTFYDKRGNVAAVFIPGGLVEKFNHDGADRVSTQYVSDGGAINNSNSQQKDWAHATSVTSDVVIGQNDVSYDSDGNVILTISRLRFDNDSTGSEGGLGSPSSGIGARVYFAANYFDAADRLTDQVNVGTNGGSAYTRPGSAPSRSDTVLVTHTDYDSAGNAYLITDPRTVKTQFSFDMLSRKTQEIDGASGSPATGQGVTNWTYDGDNNVLTMQAVFPGTSTPSQTTQYVYGVGTTSGTDLFSNDLIAKVEYPTKTGGSAGQPSTSSSDDVSYTYDLAGDVKTLTDQNGSVHAYTYDVLGRSTLDAITTLGSGVDGAIRALGFSYTALGLPYQQTSYSNSSATTVVSQVQEDYNNFGQLTKQYQEHSGSVNTGSSLKVQYSYASGTNYSRLSSMTYPNGRVLDYVYSSGLNSDISRVSELDDDAGTGAGSVEAYTYLGLSTIVQRADGNGIELTYIKQSGESNGDAGDQYIGLDRFGRVVDQRWIPASTPSSPTDRFQYGYDRDGNALYKDNKVKSTFSELYHGNSTSSGDNNTAYDNLNRITAFRRGTLSASANNSGGLDTVSTLNSNGNSSQSYTLDAVGNQTSVTTDGTSQTNTINSQNEETAAGSNNLAFDNNGSTTTDDQGHTLVFDAWNRVVAVKNGGTTLVSYAYDGDGNRVSRTASGTTTDLYNSNLGQVLEERQSATVTNQYVWSLAYVNALVLRDDNSTNGSYGKSSSGLGRRLYVQQDADFNVTTLTDTGGTVKERMVYTPYGIVTFLDSTTNWGSTSDSYSWTYTFQGGRFDVTVGMIHFGAREYSPSLERWVQKDPIEYADGMNIYQAERSNPSNRVDPLGTRQYPPNPPPGSVNHSGIPVSVIGNAIGNVVNGVRQVAGAPFNVLSGDARDTTTMPNPNGSGCDKLMVIPGILTTPETAQSYLDDLESQYGINPSDGLVGNNNTHGLGPDLIQILASELGAITAAGTNVAQQIQAMADQLNSSGSCKCKRIHVFAHSQGSQVFAEALALLNPSTRAMIDYHGYGSETFIAPNNGLAGTENTANTPDPVPWLGNVLSPLKLLGLPFLLSGGHVNTFNNGNSGIGAHGWPGNYQEPADHANLKECCDKK